MKEHFSNLIKTHNTFCIVNALRIDDLIKVCIKGSFSRK